MTVTKLKHLNIGEVKGSTAKEGVEQYLGIQYTNIKDRFAPPALNDIGFYAPTLAFAEALGGKGIKTYMYRFNEPNPREGPLKGRANHILDISFLFQNFNEYLDEAQRNSAEAFAEAVFKFVSGKAPWEEWEGGAEGGEGDWSAGQGGGS